MYLFQVSGVVASLFVSLPCFNAHGRTPDMEGKMARPKTIFPRTSSQTCGARQPDRSDYRIYATYRRTVTGTFMGELKVIRTTDDKVLFPFDGAPGIGPFETPSQARDAAKLAGDRTVTADLVCPE
jgi:hypothetical protein